MAYGAGDISKTSSLVSIVMTAGENITKGDVVTLVDGLIADVTAAEVGPFGVAMEDIANGADGPVAVAPTEIYLEVGTAGTTKNTPVMPSEGVGEEGDVVDVSSPVYNELIGIALATGTVGQFVPVKLGYY